MKLRLHLPAFVLAAVLLLSGAAPAFGEGAEAGPAPAAPVTAPVLHEAEFGGVYIGISIDDFNALGYQYGDSVDIAFSNGQTMENQPYYNGFYTVPGNTLLVGYPGYDYVKAAIDSGDDLWEVLGLEEGMTATVSLREAGAYLDIQNARNIRYEDERDLYESDEVFANFRAVEAGAIKENILYRSASPCDNQHNRAAFADALMEKAGVRFVLDTADTPEKVEGYLADEEFASPRFASLWAAGRVLPIGLNMNYNSSEFRGKLASGLTEMAENEGPYLVHCTEGKDRTGYVCMVLEALAGASPEELERDYMLTYENYYGITRDTDPDRYDIIVESVFLSMLRSMAGDADISAGSLEEYAAAMLLDAGMTREALALLRERLAK